VIEEAVLFSIPPERIDVVVHPQSAVHSMVVFCDGAVIGQASPPDMRLPIALALAWPDRLPGAGRPVDFTVAQSWTFEPLDTAAFPAVALAREALAASPWHPAVMNAANEVAVDAFLAGRAGFVEIVDTVAGVLGRFDRSPHRAGCARRGQHDQFTGVTVPAGPAGLGAGDSGVGLTESSIAAVEEWARTQAASILGVEAPVDSVQADLAFTDPACADPAYADPAYVDSAFADLAPLAGPGRRVDSGSASSASAAPAGTGVRTEGPPSS
jgi:hypothetical protein